MMKMWFYSNRKVKTLPLPRIWASPSPSLSSNAPGFYYLNKSRASESHHRNSVIRGGRTRKVLPQCPQTTLIPSGWMGRAGWAGCSSGMTITGLRLIMRLLSEEKIRGLRSDSRLPHGAILGDITEDSSPTSLVEDILSSWTCLYRWAGSYKDTAHTSSQLGGSWWAGRQNTATNAAEVL